MEFYDLIDLFGLGIIIFPQIVQSLNGTIKANFIQDFMRRISINSSSPSMRAQGKNKLFQIAFQVPVQAVVLAEGQQLRKSESGVTVNRIKQGKQITILRSPLLKNNKN